MSAIFDKEWGCLRDLGLIKKSHLDFELELFKGYRELEKFT